MYDLINWEDTREELHAIEDILAEYPPADGRLSIIEMACGTGAFLSMFHAMHPGKVIAGLDIDPRMIGFAATKLPLTARLFQQDMVEPNVTSQQYSHAVVLKDSIRHLYPAQISKHLDAMNRVVKDGGYYIVSITLGGSWADDPQHETGHVEGKGHVIDFTYTCTPYSDHENIRWNISGSDVDTPYEVCWDYNLSYVTDAFWASAVESAGFTRVAVLGELTDQHFEVLRKKR